MNEMEQKTRCAWCEKDDLYRQYHDEEWGVPEYDDAKLFEMLILETFQAGLSWHTVLKKRVHFREAFDGFDVHKVAAYSEDKVAELMANAGIIRNSLKIKGAIKNAQGFIKIQEEFGSFSHYIWGFVDHKPLVNYHTQLQDLQATSAVSDSLSKDLKKRGFAFCGSTVMYAHMQATGMVNDHLLSCWKRQQG
jgi:DNA-3-methyladenine glycosylase I